MKPITYASAMKFSCIEQALRKLFNYPSIPHEYPLKIDRKSLIMA
ncbi:hypothetical protein Aeq9CBH6_24460 [Adlercreutzia equolifaciens]|nr:hypothetical protein Aeq9CBH6_24460 [Adlercreutzia equolifaciens]